MVIQKLKYHVVIATEPEYADRENWRVIVAVAVEQVNI